MDNQYLDQLSSFRKELHANPEVACTEVETAKRVVEYIRQFKDIQIFENIGGTGVLGVFDSGNPGPSIAVRCELDALPIQETIDFHYRSKTEGVSHKCGHDGHMAIVCGLGHLLQSQPIEKGKVVLLFQPAEENGMGADAITQDPKFLSLHIDYVFALHNLPAYEKNTIVYRKDAFTAAVKSIIIKLHGKTSHAAEPEHGHNPAAAIADILQKSLALANSSLDHPQFSVVTPIYMTLGEQAYGISAGYGELHLTIRTWTEDVMEQLANQLVKIVENVSQQHTLKPEISWTQVFKANENNEEAADYVFRALSDAGNEIITRDYPFKWGEDFGLYSQQYKTCIFGLGAGLDSPALHNPDYDFPDEITATGIEAFYAIIKKVIDQ